MVVLLLALGLAVLVAVATWMGSRDGGFGGDDDSGLPCPPEQVAVAYSPADLPDEVKEAVEQALTDAGREPAEGGYGEGAERDLVVSWWPTRDPGPPEASGRSTPSLRLEQTPTAEEISEALGDRLAPCTAPQPTEEPTEDAEEREQAEEAQEDEGASVAVQWPWTGGSSPVAVIGLLVGGWWLAGPQAVSGVGTALAVVLWPVRLGWRLAQRWRWRSEVGPDHLTEWPYAIPPGERWHRWPESMHDRRTPRQQVREIEPQRRAVLRERIREERVRVGGLLLPARLWRLVYRARDDVATDDDAPEERASEEEEVLT